MATTAALLAGALLLLITFCLGRSSHRQTVVAQSTPESEWHAAAGAAKEAAYIKNLFYELGIDCPRSVPLKCVIEPVLYTVLFVCVGPTFTLSHSPWFHPWLLDLDSH